MWNKKKLAWFLFGLGSQLQLIASLSFTELFVFVATPILFFKEREHMQRNGIMPFFWLSTTVFCGCIVACITNHTSFQFALRGLAVTSLLPCSIVTGHWMLRRDMAGFKWMLLGSAISGILCTFIFQQAVEVAMLAKGQAGRSAVNAIISGPTYWIKRLSLVLLSIPKGWYLNTPLWLSASLPLFIAFFSMLTTESGRSTALGALGATALILFGGKKPSTIKKMVCMRFWLIVSMGIAGISCAKFVYQISAEKGWLGEKAHMKYVRQTKGDKSLKALILGGRMESFCGLVACVDKPIVGFGPWALDEGGYEEEFLRKYSNPEDYANYLESIRQQLEQWRFRGLRLIPCHAYITEFWLWYGIFGLFFWIYVIFILLRYLKQDCWAIPQWYMWLAAAIPSFLWGIFFSPWSDRVINVLFCVACLMARAVRQGRCRLPIEMIKEIEDVEEGKLG